MSVIQVPQGQHAVSGAAGASMTTVLGSCVAACLYDPETGVGGMTHFLLPTAASHSSRQVLHGAQAMEKLMAALLRAGAIRRHFHAKLFGGARVVDGLSDIGAQNAAFAMAFVEAESIPLVGYSLGGIHARRLRFRPASGEALMKQIDRSQAPKPNRHMRAADVQADVTLF